ncbi:hypothetical protein SUGI_0796350 [Cryptomeria japonica]|uniref:mitochondrial inner membrane protein OXA1 n=1 Tax=Cryptomeria japonica TaxID=3369 RepID=UPI0024146C90|nr:mitochondrial inner membrane protein OXA1 [Cryptomeria japonica]GLJ39064.1 hypothetical protein SUGI_0796350 [Cryptomeria japonica]
MASKGLLAKLRRSVSYRHASSWSYVGGHKGFDGQDFVWCVRQEDEKAGKVKHNDFGRYTQRFTTGFATCGLHQGIEVNFGGLRYVSSSRSNSSIGEGPDKIELLNDVAEVLGDTSIDIVNASPVVNEVAVAAADSAYPVAALQYFIEAVHLYCALPWWASIAASTLLIRSLTIPILISQLKATTRLTLMRPEMEELTQRMKQCTDPQMIEDGRQRLKFLFKKYGVSPFTPLKGLLIQGPIFISFYLAITNMAEHVPSFKEGGALWFYDLSTPDSMYVLPALTALTFLATVELNMQEGLEGNPMAAKMKTFSRFFALMTVPITMNFAKAIFCYWITSNLFSLVYGAFIRQPGIKKALGIPIITVPPEPAETSVMSYSPIQKGPPSSSLVHQRMKALERKAKIKRHGRKR